MLVEDGAVVVGLFSERGVDGEAERRRLEHLIRHFLLDHGLEAVDPRITHAVGELLLLAPCHFMGQQILERFAQDVLLDLALAAHLVRGVEAHRHVHELLVEEGHAALHAPGGHGFVGPQAVIQMQSGEFAHRLLVKLPGVRRFVEVEVAAEQLVGAFAREHHLDAHGLDVTGHQIHGGGGADGGDVIGLEVIDDVPQGIQAFLHGEVDLVVDGAQVIGHLAGGGKIWRAFQADGEGVQLGPPGLALVIVFHPAGGVELGDGGDDGRIQPAGEQHAVGHVAHQLALDRRFQRGLELRLVADVVLDRAVFHPVALVPGFKLAILAPQVVSRREGFDALAHRHQRLHLGGDIEVAVLVAAGVEGDDPHVVATNQVGILLRVVEDKGEDAVEIVQEGRALLLVEGEQHLTVGVGLELEVDLEVFLQLLVVVDLAVDRQHMGAFGVVERLGAVARVDDGQALMHQNGLVGAVDAGPVRPAVTKSLGHLQRRFAQGCCIGFDVQNAENRTHWR